MYTSVLTTALAASAATLLHLQPVAADAPPSSYGLAFPNGLHQLDTDSGGLNNVPHPSFSSSKWAWGTLPQVCFSAATKNNYCNVYDVEVYDVTYSDCQQPWTVCRCNNANMDPNTLFTNIGKLPVQARQYVRFFSAYPGSPSAFSQNNDITLFGDQGPAASVFFHETTHNLDFWIGAGGSGASYSTKDEWKGIIGKDSCVPDGYAKVSNTEDYAQVGVLTAFDANVNSIWGYGVGCMANQLGKNMEQLWSTWKYDSSKRCTGRLPQGDSPAVCMGPDARNKGNCNGVPDGKKRRDLEAAGASAADILPRAEFAGLETFTATAPPEVMAQRAKDEEARRIQAEIEAGLRQA